MGKYNMLFSLDVEALNISSKLLNLMRLPMIIKERDTLNRNKELKHYKKSDICYIIGLGPSLRKVDLRKLDGDIIATNRYVYFDDAKLAKPTFYCLPDSAFYNTDNAQVLTSALKEFPDSVFLLNGKDKKRAEDLIRDSKNIYYTFTWNGYIRPDSNIDFCKVLPLVGNVVCYAIMLALYLEYKKIYLIGCDFSSFANRKATHCYEEKDDKRIISMSYELFCYSFVAYIHEQLDKYAKAKNILIINATENSLIDAYYYDEEKIESLKKEYII